MQEASEIIERIVALAGSRAQALLWHRAQLIPAFGDRTAEALIEDGRVDEVRDYLDHIALGGFA